HIKLRLRHADTGHRLDRLEHDRGDSVVCECAHGFHIAELGFEVSGHVWFSELAILAEERGADRVGSAPVKAAGEGDDLLAAGGHARHAHRVLVCFRTGVAEESLGQRSRSDRYELLSGARTRTRIDKV